MWILVRQLSAGRLRPNHERIHGSLDVGFTLQGSVPSYGHRHQGPVVSLEDLWDGVPNASWKPVVILVQFLAHTCEQGSLTVGACRWGRNIGVRIVLGHGAICTRWTARLVANTLVMLLCHFQHYFFSSLGMKIRQRAIIFNKKKTGVTTELKRQQSGQCAFYARWATVNSLSNFSQYESVVFLFIPCLFVFVSRVFLGCRGRCGRESCGPKCELRSYTLQQLELEF